MLFQQVFLGYQFYQFHINGFFFFFFFVLGLFSSSIFIFNRTYVTNNLSIHASAMSYFGSISKGYILS